MATVVKSKKVTRYALIPTKDKAVKLEIGTKDMVFEFEMTAKDFKKIRAVAKQFKKERKRAKKSDLTGVSWNKEND